MKNKCSTVFLFFWRSPHSHRHTSMMSTIFDSLCVCVHGVTGETEIQIDLSSVFLLSFAYDHSGGTTWFFIHLNNISKKNKNLHPIEKWSTFSITIPSIHSCKYFFWPLWIIFIVNQYIHFSLWIPYKVNVMKIKMNKKKDENVFANTIFSQQTNNRVDFNFQTNSLIKTITLTLFFVRCSACSFRCNAKMNCLFLFSSFQLDG